MYIDAAESLLRPGANAKRSALSAKQPLTLACRPRPSASGGNAAPARWPSNEVRIHGPTGSPHGRLCREEAANRRTDGWPNGLPVHGQLDHENMDI
ncbi:hypothetical protein C8Q77DRAFT_732625 [Trametes polyzona]|nr:hypothetical protein C8Q77DRAFT_732625 [Trametes polyzona]